MSKEITVCLSFDVDAESAQIRQREEPGRVSKGQFAIRRGLPRILSLLDNFGIKATFFVCSWVAEKYPTITKKLVMEGHEIAAHGYLHESFDTLPVSKEREIIKESTQSLEKLSEKIKGFRAPYFRLSTDTLKLLAEANYIYDSSLMADDRPYLMEVPGTTSKLVEFPVEWFLDDWIIFEDKQHTPSAALDIWKTQFDSLYEMEDIPQNQLVYTLTLHPACIGHAYRINVLERLISHMRTKKVKFSRMVDVAETLLIKKNSKRERKNA